MLVEQKHLMRFFLEKWKASDALPSEPVVYNVAHRVVAHQLIGMDLS